MEREEWVRELIDGLAFTVPYLVKGGLPDNVCLDTASIHIARRIWSALKPAMEADPNLKRCFEAFGAAPENNDKRNALESEVKAAVSRNPALGREIKSLLDEVGPNGVSIGTVVPRFVLDGLVPGNEALRRLGMLRLLHSGIEARRIAERFGVPLREVFRINYDYSVGGVRGAVIQESIPPWIDQLDGNESLLRRLEMVRLLKAGTPASAVAQQFDALEDYVFLLAQKFAKHGLPGLMTEEDVERFRSVQRNEVSICTYNLQGVRDDGSFRFRRIARELAGYRPDLIALQEVVSGAGVEDTSGQIAHWLSAMTGEHYRSHFTYCHQFMDRYPEGVAICGRIPAKTVDSIDLTVDLAKGLRPSMDRRAQMTEGLVLGRRVILASVHLDHQGAGEVRLAQAEKLLSELDRRTDAKDYHALVLAGDFNDTADSPAIRCFKSAGYRDAYRTLHKDAGNTFPVPKPDVRIDYVLVKGPAEIVSAEVILNDPDLSDHLGLAVTIK